MTPSSDAAEVQALAEQLAEYKAAVRDVVLMLGHVGDRPVDLRDAVGQLERLVDGYDLSANDLLGLAERVRDGLWHRERAEQLLADARAVCVRRTQERDAARDALQRHVLSRC